MKRVRWTVAWAVLVALLVALASGLVASAAVAVTQISSDPYTNSTSQHKTQVEPDTFAFGSTIVAAQQTGRFYDGGSSNILWSTSTNNGASWTTGGLPGITKIVSAGNPYDRVSDPSVAYDAKHNTWLISSLAITTSGSSVKGAAVIVNRSTDGGATWSNPVTVKAATGSANLDKNWTVCDNTAASPYYGNCYTEWDDNGAGNRIYMSTSKDGGVTWGTAAQPSGRPAGLGGQPVVQPNGTVIVPYTNGNQIGAFSSTNGGGRWGTAYLVSNINDHPVAGSLRTDSLPSAEIDGAGKVYVVWQDCRFISGCTANDIVMSTSTNGSHWTAPVRIPIDATDSGVDHFIPGIAVDKTTSGASAKLALTYYYYPVAKCTAATCQLNVGFISSTNGGATWSAPTQIAGPMTLSWLPNTSQGRMVGDYISTSFAGDGLAHAAFAAAAAPTGDGDCYTAANGSCSEAIYSTATGLAAGVTPAAAQVVQNPVAMTAADHAAARSSLTNR